MIFTINFKYFTIFLVIMFIVRKSMTSTTVETALKRISDLSGVTVQHLSRFSFSDCTYYKHKYSVELETAINKQIQAEQQAAQDYLNIAVAFLHSGTSRLGAGGFFMRMFHEELEHMEEFIHYQLLRGGIPAIQGLTAPIPKPKITLIDAFKEALNMEHRITELIEKLISTAEKDKDHHCVNFVTKVFLEEQMNAIHKLSLQVTELASIGDDPDALYQYDLLLLNTYPYKFKPTKK